jgi:hypothetical protein
LTQRGLTPALPCLRLPPGRVHPDFRLDERTLPAVREICRLVEGMPLAIELSAAWCGVMEPQQVLAGIRSNLNFLSVDTLDLPERQRSLRAVFDASWNLLTRDRTLAVQRLSVFREGFTSEAAAQVGEIQAKTLLALVNKCWIARSGEDRLRMHEMIRQYAYQRLQEAGEEEKSRPAIWPAFRRLAQEAYDRMWGYDQDEWLRRLELENGNFDAAIEWGCSRRSERGGAGTGADRLDLSVHGITFPSSRKASIGRKRRSPLWITCPIRQSLAGGARQSPAPRRGVQPLPGPSERIRGIHRQAIPACRRGEDPYVLAHALLHQGVIAWVHEDLDQVRAAFLEGLQIARHLPWAGWPCCC